ncbi:MAG: hypothetical protein GX028_00110 [Clostridiaceae bacterium]|nr:hypothetical protein [Clostridiaceae bacterium]
MVNQRRTYTAARRSRASLIVLIVLALLLMIAAIVLAASLPDEIDLPDETMPVLAQPVLDTGYEVDQLQAQNTWPHGEGAVRLTNNQLTYLNIQGQEIFSGQAELTAPFCVQAGDYLLAADRDGHNYVMIDKNRVLYSGNLAGRIVGAAVREDGWLALIEDQTDGHGIVRVYEPVTGLKLFDCYFPESGYVLNVAFSPNEDVFDVALINTDGSSVQPVYKRYGLDGKELGQLMPEDATIMPMLAYDSFSQITAAGQNFITGMDYNNDQPVYVKNFSEIRTMADYDDGLLLLANERQGDKWSLYLKTELDNWSDGYEAGEDITLPAIRGNRLAIGSGTRIKVFDLKKREWLLDQNLAVEIVRVGFATDDALTVVTQDGVHRLSLSQMEE